MHLPSRRVHPHLWQSVQPTSPPKQCIRTYGRVCNVHCLQKYGSVHNVHCLQTYGSVQCASLPEVWQCAQCALPPKECRVWHNWQSSVLTYNLIKIRLLRLVPFLLMWLRSLILIRLIFSFCAWDMFISCPLLNYLLLQPFSIFRVNCG